MRDDLPLAERLHRDLRDVRWPEPAEIRARARRRSLRTAASAGVTLVLVIAGVYGVWAVERAAPPAPVAAPSASPPFVEVPHEVMLQAGDLAAKTEPELGEARVREPIRIADLLLVCAEDQGRPTDWESSRYSRSLTLLRERPPGAEGGPSDVLLSQDVYRVSPEVAGRFFARVDALVAPCVTWRSRGVAVWDGRNVRAEAVHRWETPERDFAGDESVLIRHTVPEARNLENGKVRKSTEADRTAVVRVGDLVTVITLGRKGTEPELRRLAGVAAERLCAAANPPC